MSASCSADAVVRIHWVADGLPRASVARRPAEVREPEAELRAGAGSGRPARSTLPRGRAQNGKDRFAEARVLGRRGDRVRVWARCERDVGRCFARPAGADFPDSSAGEFPDRWCNQGRPAAHRSRPSGRVRPIRSRRSRSDPPQHQQAVIGLVARARARAAEDRSSIQETW